MSVYAAGAMHHLYCAGEKSLRWLFDTLQQQVAVLLGTWMS